MPVPALSRAARRAASPRPRLLVLLLTAALGLTACNGDDGGYDDRITTLPTEPAGLGSADTAPVPTAVAYVDTGASNQRNNPCQVALETNAGVRVLQGFLDVWTPSSLKVDAGVTLAAANGCPAVTASTWTGLPGDASDGSVKNATVHAANINYVKTVTQARTPAQALAAYLDDRRAKGYSVSDGLGPLTSLWRAGAGKRRMLTATLSRAKDPADVYRVLIPARRRIIVNASQLDGDIILSALKPKAKSIYNPGKNLIVKSNRPYPKTEGIVVRNLKKKPQAIWLAVTPSPAQSGSGMCRGRQAAM